eukprot:2582291-Amphidinium_carterae.3
MAAVSAVTICGRHKEMYSTVCLAQSWTLVCFGKTEPAPSAFVRSGGLPCGVKARDSTAAPDGQPLGTADTAHDCADTAGLLEPRYLTILPVLDVMLQMQRERNSRAVIPLHKEA